MAKIPSEVIDDIRSRADIVELINRFVPLKRAGQNFKGACPFHKEKTPSFIVSPGKSIYHCFGCHAGGNVFSFIMQYDQVNFIEAVKKMGSEVGIDVQRYLSQDEEENSARGLMYQVNQIALEAYSLALKNNTHPSQYFQMRTIDDSLIEKFKLGYAPDSWNYLKQKLTKDQESVALKLGLLSEHESRGSYDKLRNRVIFPIFSTSNQVLGFGGRRLNEQQNPKYLNSPESEIYNKRNILFGLSHATQAIRQHDCCYLVEGYLDVIRCHQYGIENVVASSGTALTDGHARLVARYTKNITLLFDSDNAGIDAAIRSIPILLKQNLNIRIVPMPTGSDPDTILVKYGREKFDYFISKAYDFIEFQYRLSKKRNLLNTAQGKTQLVKQIGEQINHISDPILREMYINEQNQNSKLFGVDLKKMMKRAPQNRPEDEEKKQIPSTEKILSYINQPKYNKEKQLLGLLLNLNKEQQSRIIRHIHLELFENKVLKRIMTRLIEQYEDHGQIDLNELMEKDEHNILQSIYSELSIIEYDNAEQFIYDFIFDFEEKHIETEIEECQSNLTDENWHRIQELQQERINLRANRQDFIRKFKQENSID